MLIILNDINILTYNILMSKPNRNRSILTNSIDDIDTINKSGSLEGLTYYQHKNDNLTEKELELSILDSDSDNNSKENESKIEVTDMIKHETTFEIENEKSDNENDEWNLSNAVYYSQYFSSNVNKEKSPILNMRDIIKEILVVIMLHMLLGIMNALFNVITIDGILSCLIFYMNFIGIPNERNFLLKNRLNTLDRYIYYLLLFTGYYIFSYMSWFNYSNITIYLSSIMICPSIMDQIYNLKSYKKIHNVLYEGYNKLIQKIICKQLAKVVNLIIKNVLNLNVKINYEDLIPYYDKFSLLIINRFILTFILACIFNHIDKGGMRLPMMIYKNLYLKDSKYKISNDKEYLKKIIDDKNWSKFMDVYTLNRIIRMMMSDDSQNTYLSDQVSMIIGNIVFRINRLMFCWTVMSVTNLTMGILSFFAFIIETEKPLKYIINTLIYLGISFMSSERLLILILCELSYPIANSKIISDIVNDTYKSVKSGLTSLCYRTRLESVILSLSLGYLSYVSYNKIGIITVCILNFIVMMRLSYVKEFKNKKISQFSNSRFIQYPVRLLERSGFIKSSNSYIDKNDVDHDHTNNNMSDNVTHNHDIDILIFIKDKLKELLKNNLLIKVFNPFIDIDSESALRLFLHLFMLLIFGYLSSFSFWHIILLPIVIQNIVDLIY